MTHLDLSIMSASIPADTSTEAGKQMENINSLRDYESYGISYNAEDGHWYYNNQRIGLFVDSKNAIVYWDDGGNICLSALRNQEQEIIEIKEISEADAQSLLQNNNPAGEKTYNVS